MDLSSYEQKIQLAEQKRDHLYRQLEANAASYIGEATAFFPGKFRSMVEEEISGKPAAIQDLGIDKLRELKTNLTSLIQNCPEIVSKHLNRPEIWEHRQPLPDTIGEGSYLTTEASKLFRKAGDRVREELRAILGYMGQHLVKLGLAKAGRDEAWEVERGSELPRYKYGFMTSPEMDSVMTRHKELLEAYLMAHSDIEAAKARFPYRS